MVLLEDVGAETGLVLALGGLIMAEVTGDARWDAVGSISIGILLVCIAMVLAVEMKGLLIGESATDQVQDAIEASITTAPHVNGLIHIRSMHLGPDDLLVAAKVEFDQALTVPELSRAVDGVEVAMRASVPEAHLTIYLEPDIRRVVAE